MKNSTQKVLLIFAFLLCGLNYLQASSKTQTTGLEKISPSLLQWNETRKIKLLPHQLKPINYLEQNQDVKGLLIYHYLGTGKTFLALGFAERNPNREVVIFAPNFLVNHWKNSLDNYGVSDKSRYRIISHKSPDEILKLNLSNSVLIVDESHNIIKKISDPESTTADKYAAVYSKLRTGYKILSLTGTPIFTSSMDLSYQINLVSGKDLLPFNQEHFRRDYTEIDIARSIFSGHFLDSTILQTGLWPVLTLSGIGPIQSTIVSLTPSLANKSLLLHNFESNNSLRNLNIKTVTPYLEKYVSYYNFTGLDASQYPTKEVIVKELDYNAAQIDFLFRFADNLLDDRELALITKDKDYELANLKLKNYQIQKRSKEEGFYDALGIGNLVFKGNKELVFPNKFSEALKLMQSTNRPVVIYSNFYYTGINLFKKFLDHKGFRGQYDVVMPDVSQEEFNRIMNKYNSGKTKFLLLHPEITEGISLMGSAQLHILESPANSATLEQIIGRVVRYKSHAMLPEKQRHVEVYIWLPIISSYDITHWTALRRHHYQNYSEISFYHAMKDRVDRNAIFKDTSPDSVVYRQLNTTEKDTATLLQTLKLYSVDSNYYKISK
ncbi:MAG: hypothetical protein K9G11_04650 [Rickettsiaceae bacterium]|nr:hypothetical protein [Rickettsiaceae bacterium]